MSDAARALSACLPKDPTDTAPGMGVPTAVVRDAATRLELLQVVADVAVDVLTTVHERFREDIDFNVLWDALAAGLYPADEPPIPDGGT